MGATDTARLERRIAVLEEHVGKLNAWKQGYDDIVAKNTKEAAERKAAKVDEVKEPAVADPPAATVTETPVAPQPKKRRAKAKGGE